MPDTPTIPKPEKPIWAKDVHQETSQISGSSELMDTPVFKEPRTFTRIPKVANGPLFFTHKHNLAVTALAIKSFYSMLHVISGGVNSLVFWTVAGEKHRDILLQLSRPMV